MYFECDFCFFKDLDVCNPDGICAKIKNPTQYAKRRIWIMQNEQKNVKVKKESKVKKTED